MRTWRRLVIALAVAGTVFLFYRWWQNASSRSRVAPRPHGGSDEPEDSAVAWGLPPSAGAPSPSPTEPQPPRLDREKADRMREQIRALLAEAGAFAAPGASASAAASAARPGGSFATMPLVPDGDAGDTKVDPDYIRSRVREDLFPLAKQCYATALEKKPRLAGRLAVYFRVIGDRKVGGVVDEVKIMGDTTLDDAEMQTCVRESMMSVSFDAPPDDGKLSVVYPILFSPDEPD